MRLALQNEGVGDKGARQNGLNQVESGTGAGVLERLRERSEDRDAVIDRGRRRAPANLS